MGIVFGVGLFRSDSHGMLGHSQSNDGAKKSFFLDFYEKHATFYDTILNWVVMHREQRTNYPIEMREIFIYG